MARKEQLGEIDKENRRPKKETNRFGATLEHASPAVNWEKPSTSRDKNHGKNQGFVPSQSSFSSPQIPNSERYARSEMSAPVPRVLGNRDGDDSSRLNYNHL